MTFFTEVEKNPKIPKETQKTKRVKVTLSRMNTAQKSTIVSDLQLYSELR